MKAFPPAAILGLATSFPAQAAEPQYPKLFFSYSYLYDDTVCGQAHPVKPAWAEEARRRTQDFAKLWEKEAPAILGRLLADFGKGFTRRELTATLSACTESWSFSNPLVLRSLNFLKSYLGERPVWEDHAFVNQVFHELLHTWLVDNFEFSSSPLIQKYKDEPDGVRAHLHLIALQKHIYAELGRQDLQDWIAWLYPRMTSGGEPRAWEIVGKEGHASFIKELKAKPRLASNE